MRLGNTPIWHKLLLFIAVLIVFCNNSWAQDIIITGTVTSGESGEPLPGVNVIIEGTQQGTVTSIDGMYEISLPSGQDKLYFSFIGFLSESIDPGGRTTIDIRLIPDIEELDEVVVIGYGTMRKKDLTGAVTSIKTADIEANKSTNALQALQGRVAGLDLTQSDGQAGSGINLTMRGIRSLSAGNDPLILVDGVEYGSTLDINTSDIESIDILKDVASTAIYGTKGANGVILVTTKRGGQGKTSVSYSNYFSYNAPTFLPHIINGQEFQEKKFQTIIANEEYKLWQDAGIKLSNSTGEVSWDETAYPEPWNVFGSLTLDQVVADRGVANQNELLTQDPTALELLRNNVSLDFLDMIVANSWSQNHEVSVTGGDEKTAYNLSLGFMDDKGLLPRDEMKRYNLSIGVDHSINKSIKVGTNILYTYKEFDKRNGGIFNQALKCGPIGTLYQEDGVTYNTIPDPIWAANQKSPMLDVPEGIQIHDIFSNRIFGSTYFNWEIINGLSFRSSLGIDINITKEGKYNDAQSLSSNENRAELNNRDSKSYTWNNILTYKKSVGIHNIQLMAGSETYKYQLFDSRMVGINQPFASTEYYDFNGIAQGDREYSSGFEERQMVSFFGRTNYGLMDKYLFQATLRYDGASQLYPGHKWSVFPSASAGWRISEEDFLQNIEVVSNLKLRYSWGIAGNAAVPPYSSQTKLSTTLSYYTLGDQVYSQYIPLTIGNSGLGWERTASHNIGVDFSLFMNRLNGTVDYYNSRTYDLLFKVLLPPVNVYADTWDNVASTKNRGIEINLNGAILNKKAFKWDANLNFSRNKGEVLELQGDITELVRTDDGNEDKKWEVGSPQDAFYIYEFDGIYQIEDLKAELEYVSQQNATGDSIERGLIPMIANKYEPGDIRLIDKNGDGDFTEEDKILLDASPSFIFGIGSNFSLNTNAGNFGLRISAMGRWGQTISYGFYDRIKDSRSPENGAYVDAWTPQNTGADFPRYSENGNNQSQLHMEALKYVDGSFIKIRDITLSYTLPKTWLNFARIENLELYASAKNMFTFSKLDNYDPERGGGFGFPLQKNWIFGVNVNF